MSSSATPHERKPRFKHYRVLIIMAVMANALGDALGDPVLEQVLRDIAAITRDDESAGSSDGVEIVIIGDAFDSTASGSSSAGGFRAVDEEIVVTVAEKDSQLHNDELEPPRASSVVTELQSIRPEPLSGDMVAANPYSEWQSEFSDGDIAPWRHQPRHSFPVLDQPPVSVIPAAAACVLFLLVAAWSQVRRTRRRVVDSDWLLDVDLMEASYRDNHGSGASR